MNKKIIKNCLIFYSIIIFYIFINSKNKNIYSKKNAILIYYNICNMQLNRIIKENLATNYKLINYLKNEKKNLIAAKISFLKIKSIIKIMRYKKELLYINYNLQIIDKLLFKHFKKLGFLNNIKQNLKSKKSLNKKNYNNIISKIIKKTVKKETSFKNNISLLQKINFIKIKLEKENIKTKAFIKNINKKNTKLKLIIIALTLILITIIYLNFQNNIDPIFKHCIEIIKNYVIAKKKELTKIKNNFLKKHYSFTINQDFNLLKISPNQTDAINPNTLNELTKLLENNVLNSNIPKTGFSSFFGDQKINDLYADILEKDKTEAYQDLLKIFNESLNNLKLNPTITIKLFFILFSYKAQILLKHLNSQEKEFKTKFIENFNKGCDFLEKVKTEYNETVKENELKSRLIGYIPLFLITIFILKYFFVERYSKTINSHLDSINFKLIKNIKNENHYNYYLDGFIYYHLSFIKKYLLFKSKTKKKQFNKYSKLILSNELNNNQKYLILKEIYRILN